MSQLHWHTWAQQCFGSSPAKHFLSQSYFPLPKLAHSSSLALHEVFISLYKHLPSLNPAPPALIQHGNLKKKKLKINQQLKLKFAASPGFARLAPG